MKSDFDDPAIATRLIDFIDRLKNGSNVAAAAREAGIDRDTALSFLDSVGKRLAGSAGLGLRETSRGDTPMVRSGLHIVAVCDGASRGNPGAAACAVIISDPNGEELLRRAERLGVATNNVAEYRGVILALELARSLGASDVVVKLDSELVVKQLKGLYKVKHPSLKPLFEKVRLLASGFASFQVAHVPRSETAEADKLANTELDGKND